MNLKLSTPRLKKLFLWILLTLFGGLMYVSQVIMASLPNMEIVSLLIIVIARKFSYRVIFSIYIFVLCEILTYGLSMWVINYLYVWLILAVLICLLRKLDNVLLYAFVSAVFGLIFGTLCSIPYFITLGFGGGIAYIVNGLWFDILHCAGNLIATLLLYKPLTKALERGLKAFI